MLTYRVLFLFALLLLPLLCSATGNDSKPVRLFYEDGISFEQDSSFSVLLRGRIQNRFIYEATPLNPYLPHLSGVSNTRTRLILSGNSYGKKLSFLLQIGFGQSDQDDYNQSNDVLRDAVIWYHPIKNLHIGFGQTKLPGNRQRQVSSQYLYFCERALANNYLNIDRDQGVFLYGDIRPGKQVIHFRSCLSTGEGRNIIPTDYGLAYTGQLEYCPLGDFGEANLFSEGDLLRENKPRLSISASVHYNDAARRTMGETGSFLSRPNYFLSYFSDLTFRYAGFEINAEYLARKAAYQTDKSGHIPLTGDGYTLQASYTFNDKWGLGFRKSKFEPQKINRQNLREEIQHSFVLNRFFKGHKIKLQFEVYSHELFYRTSVGNIYGKLNHIGAMVQFEFGF